MNDQTPHNAAVDAATGTGKPIDAWPPLPEELAAAAIHRAAAPMQRPPAQLTSNIASKLDALIDAQAVAERDATTAPIAFTPVVPQRSRAPWLLAAAAFAISTVAVIFFAGRAANRAAELAASRQQLVALQTAIDENKSVLALANTRLEQMAQNLATAESSRRAADTNALEVAKRNTQLAQQLSDVTERYATQSRDLNEAKLAIAKLEAPADPQIALQNRQKLLEVPDTIRVAWAPFNLEGLPAPEQPNITGDVVWNDRLESGYLRFVGLKVNDPAVEQYQVWVIDERGLEQKVSGGIFNANANGEVIVPITPGIPVGKVALFAITVEKPGGTWVPDLKRRVVVAPRS